MAKRTNRRRSAVRPQQVRRWLKRLAILVVAAAIGYGLLSLLGARVNRPGYAVADQGRAHMEDTNCTYRPNSSPPTSGCHSRSQAAYGVHEEPIPGELQVHNLEHGAVIIQYRPSGIIGVGDALAEDLRSLVNHMRGQDPRYCRLIVAPYPFPFAQPHRPAEESAQKVIALTAWGRMDLLEEYDEARIRKFIDAFINRGPESGQVSAAECQ